MTAVLRIVGTQGDLALEMPGVTTMKYAARRVAAALGLDEDAPGWRLLCADGAAPAPVPEDDLAADWSGRRLFLGQE